MAPLIENYEWSTSTKSNQAFIEEMIQEGLKLGVSAGIYSSHNSWEGTVGLDYDYPSSVGLPLWVGEGPPYLCRTNMPRPSHTPRIKGRIEIASQFGDFPNG